MYGTRGPNCFRESSRFVSYRPQVALSKLVQYLKGGSSRILLQEYASLRKQFWGRHLWTRGYMAISSGNITDELIQRYIEEQEGEPMGARSISN